MRGATFAAPRGERSPWLRTRPFGHSILLTLDSRRTVSSVSVSGAMLGNRIDSEATDSERILAQVAGSFLDRSRRDPDRGGKGQTDSLKPLDGTVE